MIHLVRYAIAGLLTHALTSNAQAVDTSHDTSTTGVSYQSSSDVTSTVPTSASITVANATSQNIDASQVDSTPKISISSTTAVSASTVTCASRTVNYITHTLAQQCLRADWTRSRGSTNTSSSTPATTASQDPINETVSKPYETTTAVSIAHASGPTGTAPSFSAEAATESETDWPLDTANFLSFEDWKKQNLARAGQSRDNFNVRQSPDQIRRSPTVNALDSLGEESEIELDFSGFRTPVLPEQQHARSEHSSELPSPSDVTQTSPASQVLRPRDAGKTCKERTNYASFDCAATVLKSNSECKSASSVLVENKDSYMLNKCSADNKYFIVELCNDILVDTVVLANYEFFSSIFRTFRVSVSDRYPAKAEKWKDLGTFEARNTREVQAFLIENPLIWARFLRVEFLTHYGNEYYCPVSLLRVHGTTMMEEFRHQEEFARGEPPDDESVTEPAKEVEIENGPASGLPGLVKDAFMPPASMIWNDTQANVTLTTSIEQETAQTTSVVVIKDLITTSPLLHQIRAPQSTCPSDDETSTTAHHRSSSVNVTSLVASSSLTSLTSTKPASASAAANSLSGNSSPSTEKASIVSIQSPSSISSNSSNESKSGSAVSPSSPASDLSSKETRPALESVKSTAVTPPQAQPSTQESFFKSISKRLQQLESNSTLSLQYIEEQSRLLRDAFSKVEKRQIRTTTSFLATLNNTVMAELAGFRQAYDQLWQSTVIELEGQQEQHHREMTALSSRLTLVVDELVWQKRMGIVQSTLLLLCLGLVVFARPGNGSFEASLMQQVMARSQAAFGSGNGSQQNSPASPGRSPVRLIRRNMPLWRTAEPVAEIPEEAGPMTSTPDGLRARVEAAMSGESSSYEHDDNDDQVSDACSVIDDENGPQDDAPLLCVEDEAPEALL